jgi:DNA uptake protein ComE-like DNA-binding protein
MSQGAVRTYTFTNVVANHTIQASFARDSDPCQDCLSRLNGATVSQFDAVDGIGEVKAQALMDGQPFVVPMCSLADIEAVVDSVAGIGDVLRERIVRHFCPALYGE